MQVPICDKLGYGTKLACYRQLNLGYLLHNGESCSRIPATLNRLSHNAVVLPFLVYKGEAGFIKDFPGSIV